MIIVNSPQRCKTKNYPKFHQEGEKTHFFYFDEQLPWISNLNIRYGPARDWWEAGVSALPLRVLLPHLCSVLSARWPGCPAPPQHCFLPQSVPQTRLPLTTTVGQRRNEIHVQCHLVHPLLVKKSLSPSFGPRDIFPSPSLPLAGPLAATASG